MSTLSMRDHAIQCIVEEGVRSILLTLQFDDVHGVIGEMFLLPIDWEL